MHTPSNIVNGTRQDALLATATGSAPSSACSFRHDQSFVIGLTCDLHLLLHENRTGGDLNRQTFHVRRSHNTTEEEEEEVMGHHYLESNELEIVEQRATA